MPIYEYTCKDCSHEFEALVYGREKAECPKCHSKRFAVAGKSGSSAGTTETGACGSCGDPRGPGSCSLPDVD